MPASEDDQIQMRIVRDIFGAITGDDQDTFLDTLDGGPFVVDGQTYTRLHVVEMCIVLFHPTLSQYRQHYVPLTCPRVEGWMAQRKIEMDHP